MANDNGFTPRARYALVMAKEEAHKMNAESIAAHHLLLALLSMEDGVAVEILKKLNVNIARLRMEIEKSCGSVGGAPADGAPEGAPLPFNSEMKRVLIKAHEEAREMNYNFIGTEHLLLGNPYRPFLRGILPHPPEHGCQPGERPGRGDEGT